MDTKKLSVYYFASTHWDREWYQPFQGFRYRLVEMTNELIEVLESNPNYGVFHFDGQTIVLEDYLEIEPEKKERLAKLIQDKKLLIGPWYVMPDELLLSGESLIRNLMMGHRISKAWGVEAWKYGYICDIFGHIAQMPQIFKGFDIQYALLGRGTNEHTLPAHFIWKSPDGSECITFKLKDSNGYGAFCLEVLGWDSKYKILEAEALYPKIKKYIDHEKSRTELPIVLIADGMDHEPIHNETPEYINMIQELYPDAEIKQVDLVEMGKELEQYRSQLPVRAGELIEPGKIKDSFIHLITHTLSSRYPIKKANDECQALLEKWVETLTAIAELRGFSIQKSYVDLAYKYLIQNHPHDSICGCSIDQVHKDMEYRFDQTKMISSQIVESVMNYERNQHSLDKDSQTRVLQLWNPLPYPRKGVITVDIDFNKDYQTRYQEPFNYEEKNSFKILDHKGNEIPYGLVSMKKNYRIRRYNQYDEMVDLHTVSLEVDMPAMGTVEYKIVPYNEASRYLAVMAKSPYEVENEYISLKVNDNGTINIYDKVSQKSYDQLLSFVDDGEIGDGWYHANPAEDRVITSIGSDCTIERVENGPARTVFKITNYMRVPAFMDYHVHGIRRSQETTTLQICSLVGLSKGSKAVDIETTIHNTAKDHRVRLLMPTGIDSRTYFTNQPFTFVERKTGIDLETQSWSECEVPEKQMGGIVGLRHPDKTGLAFASAYGLHECAVLDDKQTSMMVTLFRCFKKTVLTNGEISGQLLGELCFKYSIVPMQANTTYADLIRLQDCMQAGFRSTSFRVEDAYQLPDPKSYFEIDSEAVCLSMMKRPESGEKSCTVLRLYNMSDGASHAMIKCFKEIKGAEAVNLNEEYIGEAGFDKYTVDLEFGAWEIKTISLKFM